MTLNEIEEIKRDLIYLLVNLTRNSNALLEKWASEADNFPDDLDKAILHTEMDFAFARLFREGLTKQSISRALNKIEDGTYGICEQCEEEIPINRLKAIPDASFCIACQMELEREQKMVA